MQLTKRELYKADLIAEFLDYSPCGLDDIIEEFKWQMSEKDIKKILKFFKKNNLVFLKNNKYFIDKYL